MVSTSSRNHHKNVSTANETVDSFYLHFVKACVAKNFACMLQCDHHTSVCHASGPAPLNCIRVMDNYYKFLLRHFPLIGEPRSWRSAQAWYIAVARPFSLSKAEYVEKGVACETRQAQTKQTQQTQFRALLLRRCGCGLASIRMWVWFAHAHKNYKLVTNILF